MATNGTTLSGIPPKTVLDPADRFIIYSPTSNGSFAIAASNLVEPAFVGQTGFTTLGGGVVLNWGSFSANNSVAVTLTFKQPYVTSAFTMNTAATVEALTLTGATVIGTTVANATFYYHSLGI